MVSNSADLLRITPETALALDPIILTTSRAVLPHFDFVEEITGMEVAVRIPQRDIGAITRVGQDDELQKSSSRALVSGGGC